MAKKKRSGKVFVYVYEESGKSGVVLTLMKQLSERSGMSYWRVRRVMNVGGVYVDPRGKFRMERMEYLNGRELQ